MAELQGLAFVVDEKPFCVWDFDLTERNVDMFSRLDARYFSYLADKFAADLEGEEKHRAAVSLRSTYAHALETFFALLFAALQAPDCVPGWLSKYQVSDLRSLADKVSRYRRIRTRVVLPEPWWHGVARALHPVDPTHTSAEHVQLIREGFGEMWARFAHNLLDETHAVEYNSIKHGLRLTPGGFTLAIGAEHEYGVAPPAQEMRSLGGSEFGCTIFRPEQVGPKRNHFRLRRHSFNWAPDNLVAGLRAIALSIQNVVAFLHSASGITEGVTVEIPPDPEWYWLPWRVGIGVKSSAMDYIIRAEEIRVLSDEEILATYDDAPVAG